MEEMNQNQELRHQLIRAAYWIRHKMKKFLEPHGLTQQQFNVLRVLREEYPMPVTTRDISDRLSDPYGDTSRVVDRLVKKEYVLKNTNKEDRRLVKIRITRQGLELLSKIDLQQEELDAMVGQLNEDKIQQLTVLLAELTEEHFQPEGKQAEKV